MMDAPQLGRPPTSRHPQLVWPADASSQQASEHFLVASDDDQFRDIVKLALQQLGHRASFVRSGLDVMNSSCACRPSLVLLDQCLRDVAALDVARTLSTDKRQRFAIIGRSLTTPLTVAVMKLGALTVLEKPVTLTDTVALFRSLVDELRTAMPPTDRSATLRTPHSVAERWALKVLKGCEAGEDLRTLAVWASVAGLSYTSLCETCRLAGVRPLAARDLTRVLRALVQSRVHDCRIGELLDICDKRTLNALMERASLDPKCRGCEISTDQFLTLQRFVPASNAGLAMLRSLSGVSTGNIRTA